MLPDICAPSWGSVNEESQKANEIFNTGVNRTRNPPNERTKGLGDQKVRELISLGSKVVSCRSYRII